MTYKFTWVPFYNELSNWLLDQKDNQKGLIQILQTIGITGFRDGSKSKEIDLEEIDPFTFLSYLNKYHSDKKRVEILQSLIQNLGIRCQVPTDVAGIPTIHPMKVHLFPIYCITACNV